MDFARLYVYVYVYPLPSEFPWQQSFPNVFSSISVDFFNSFVITVQAPFLADFPCLRRSCSGTKSASSYDEEAMLNKLQKTCAVWSSTKTLGYCTSHHRRPIE